MKRLQYLNGWVNLHSNTQTPLDALLTPSILATSCCNGIWETTRHNRHNGLLSAPTCYGLVADLLLTVVGCGYCRCRWLWRWWSCGSLVRGSTWPTWHPQLRSLTLETVLSTPSGLTRTLKRLSVSSRYFCSSFCLWWCSPMDTLGWRWYYIDVSRQLKLLQQVSSIHYFIRLLEQRCKFQWNI